MKRAFKVMLIPAVLAGAVAVAFGWWTRQVADDAPDTIRLYGAIDIRDAQLAFTEQERIAEVLVEEGQRVADDQPLARLHNRRLTAQLKQAEAEMAARQQILNRLLAGTRKQEIEQARAERDAARVRVANARRSLERIRTTAGAGVSSQQALDDAKALLDVVSAQMEVAEQTYQLALEGPRPEDIAEARSRLEAGRAALEQLHIRLADTVLRAPAAGVVRSRILEPGEMADPSRPVLTLSLTDPKWVRAYLPEPDLGHLRPGMPAKIISDSFAGRTFEGWVGFISPEAEFTPKNVETTDLRTQLVYEVRVFVRDPSDQLRLGMPVTVAVEREPGLNQ